MENLELTRDIWICHEKLPATLASLNLASQNGSSDFLLRKCKIQSILQLLASQDRLKGLGKSELAAALQL